MDASTIEALGRASSLELFHLSSVIDRLMSDPKRILEIRRQLHLGQTVRYADCRALGAGLNLRSGRIVAMKDTTLIVKDDELRYEWKLPYAAIEVPSTDDPATLAHEPRDEPPRPNRDDFRVGDRVGFDDRHLQTHIGTVVRINHAPPPSTATAITGAYHLPCCATSSISDPQCGAITSHGGVCPAYTRNYVTAITPIR